jgi:rubrerythrin
MSKTAKDLMDAFAGESQANRRYLAYSQRAEDEFQHGVAKLFRKYKGVF